LRVVVVKALFLAVLPQSLQPVHLFSSLSSSFCTFLKHDQRGFKDFHKTQRAISNKYEASAKASMTGQERISMSLSIMDFRLLNTGKCALESGSCSDESIVEPVVLFVGVINEFHETLCPNYRDLIVRVVGKAQVYRAFMRISKLIPAEKAKGILSLAYNVYLIKTKSGQDIDCKR
ncbi:hypothetical protein EV360DRAFT_77254, partial [Lentinula raphanica]